MLHWRQISNSRLRFSLRPGLKCFNSIITQAGPQVNSAVWA